MQTYLEAHESEARQIRVDNASLEERLRDVDIDRVGADDPELRSVRQANHTMREELRSLKAMFERRVVRDEDKFEQLIREKEDACQEWLRTKTTEINNMKHALVILRYIFKAKKMKNEQATLMRERELEAMKDSFDREAELLRADVRAAGAQSLVDKAAIQKKYQGLLDFQGRQCREVEVRVDGLEMQLAEVNLEASSLQEERDEVHRTEMELERKLAEVNDANSRMFEGGINTREEQLEAEVRKMKKLLNSRSTNEADALKKELMQYVALAVKLMPQPNTSTRLPSPDTPPTRLPSPSSRGSPCTPSSSPGLFKLSVGGRGKAGNASMERFAQESRRRRMGASVRAYG